MFGFELSGFIGRRLGYRVKAKRFRKSLKGFREFIEEDAEIEADKYGIPPSEKKQNDDRDAFRHTYVSAVTTYFLGPAISEAFGNLVELKSDIFNNQPANVKHMDLHNNRVGREIGAAARNSSEISPAIYEVYKAGGLILRPPTDNNFLFEDLSERLENLPDSAKQELQQEMQLKLSPMIEEQLIPVMGRIINETFAEFFTPRNIGRISNLSSSQQMNQIMKFLQRGYRNL